MQGPTLHAVGASGVFWNMFSSIISLSFSFSCSLRLSFFKQRYCRGLHVLHVTEATSYRADKIHPKVNGYTLRGSN